MKKILYTFCLLSFSGYALAFSSTTPPQDDLPEEEVMKVIDQLFDGMRAGDSAMVHATFDESVRMLTIGSRNGQPVMREGSLERFLTAVGTPHDAIWDEKIWDEEVKIDRNMATVWVKYAFFLGTEFSHCGVNSFQLFKGTDGWKIINLSDTRSKTNCEMPPDK
ncbi:nuclear transport factor 2 family protein [Fulvivirgaceae bacterium BMA10]|uniref:Nuclear transport factor 2 family protein n=1 Tax=Splendidivirga corallicola TaxID=3051826 RepID=A0ABT8KP23_9BACT|nr:nuclear transport factor 2 family protein [Fulvivirgaceae bacterium BMA10]